MIEMKVFVRKRGLTEIWFCGIIQYGRAKALLFLFVGRCRFEPS